MTTGPFSVGSVHVDVDIDAAEAKRKIESALKTVKANVNVDVTKADLDDAKKKIKDALSDITASIGVSVNKADLKAAQAKIKDAFDKITVDVTARITKVIEPKVNPVISVTARITNTIGGGGLVGGGRGGKGRQKSDLDPFGGFIRSLKGAGSGGFFEGITTAMGTFVEVAMRGTLLIGKGFTKLGGAVTNFGQKLGKLGGAFAKLGGGFARMGAAMSQLAAPVGALALYGLVKLLLAGVQLLAPLAFNLVGIMALLGGAMANTAAAGAVLGPVIASLGIGIGVALFAAKDAVPAFEAMAKAITSGDAKDMEAYNEELKKLGPNARAAVKAAEPIVKTFAGMRREMQQRFFEGTANGIKNLKPLMDSLKEPILNIATAMGNVVDKFLQLGTNTTFVASVQTLFASAVPIIEHLGTVAANVFAGLTNFFALLSPFAEQFARDLENISVKFLAWTESEESRQDIIDFFTKAYDIAKDVGNIIGTLGQIMMSVFTATQDPLGKNEGFLDKINRKLDEWLAWIQSEEGQKTIHKWLDQAAQFARDVWNAVEKIVQKFSEWNTPENQKALRDTVTTFGNWATKAMELVGHMEDLLGLLDAVRDPIGFIKDKVTGAGNEAEAAVRGVRNAPFNKGKAYDVFSPTGGKSYSYKAAGGLVGSATPVIVGEAGLEAIIPLNRPLGQVDPSVRAMAALLRGEKAGKNPNAGIGAAGKTYNVTQNIQLSQADPEAAAASVVNRLMSAAMR